MDINAFLSTHNNLEKAKELAKASARNKLKIAASHRTEPLELDSNNLSEAKHGTMSNTIIKRSVNLERAYMNIKARINTTTDTGGTALFYTDENHDIAYFYKLLTTRRLQHMKCLSGQDIPDIEQVYKSPFNRVEFKYQTAKNAALYYDKADNIVFPEKCIGELCCMTLTIVPYDFLSKSKKRIIGMNIRVSKIKII